MPKPKRDVEERLRVQSILASAAAAFVDHRVLFQIGVVCLAIVVLRAFGPDEIGRSIDYVGNSEPVRFVGRALAGVRGIAIGVLRKADEATRGADVPAVGTPSAAPSTQPAPGAGITAGASDSRGATGQQGRSIGETLAPLYGTAAGGGPVGATGTSDAPEPVLWSFVKDEETIRIELHDQRADGVDLLVFRNGRLWRRERWADRAAARAEVNRKRADLEKEGWRPLDCCVSR